MTDMASETRDELLRLAAACEGASGADRKLDLAVYLNRNPDGDVAKMMARGTEGLDGSSRFAWELRGRAFLFEQRNDQGNCTYSGGIPVPAYTSSLDAAMALVGPFTWPHTVTMSTAYGSASVIPNDGKSTGIHDKRCGHCNGASTPALALCAAALRASAGAA